MAPERKPWVGGNWKCNGTIANVKKLATHFKTVATSNADVVIFPAPVHISETLANLGDKIQVGSQNVSHFGSGAYTGEVSAEMLVDMNVKWTLIGHSERREHFKETDELTAAKVSHAFSHGMRVALCVGESLKERKEGRMADVLRRQIEACLPALDGHWDDTVIAYEPIWAIGTGVVATPEQAQEAILFLRNLIRQAKGDAVADKLRIVYGGSVSPSNCTDLINQKDVDGFLVGGASLKESFVTIIDAATKSCKKSLTYRNIGEVTTGGMPDEEKISAADSVEPEVAEGLKIAHRARELRGLRAGEELILTLKDRPLINEEGTDVAQDEDILENLDLAKHSLRLKRKAERDRKTAYTPFDEDEDVLIHFGTADDLREAAQKKREILSHYDDWAVETGMVKRPENWDSAGADTLEKVVAAASQTVDRKFAGAEGFTNPSTLSTQRDYMSVEEAETSLAKGFRKKKKKAQKQNIRQSQTAVEKTEVIPAPVGALKVESAAAPESSGFMDPDAVEAELLYNHLAQHRKRLGRVKLTPVTEAIKSIKGDEEALSLITSNVKMEDDLLPSINAVPVEPAAANQPVATSKEDTSVGKFHCVMVSDLLFASETDAKTILRIKRTWLTYSPLMGLELTDAAEFCRGLETPAEKLEFLQEQATAAAALLRLGTNRKRGVSTVSSSSSSQKGAWRRDNADNNAGEEPHQNDAAENTLPDDAKSDDEDLTPAEEAVVSLIAQETLVDDSLASALKLLNRTKDLELDAKWRLKRHVIDDKPLEPATASNDVRLEYKDEFGRLLTPKEAFRRISWAFHGKGPGKRKQEKLLMRIKAEKKRLEVQPNVLPTMRALRTVQNKFGQAHLVLSSSVI